MPVFSEADFIEFENKFATETEKNEFLFSETSAVVDSKELSNVHQDIAIECSASDNGDLTEIVDYPTDSHTIASIEQSSVFNSNSADEIDIKEKFSSSLTSESSTEELTRSEVDLSILLEEYDQEENGLDELFANSTYKSAMEHQSDVVDIGHNKSYVNDYQKNNDNQALSNLLLANEKLVWKIVLQHNYLATVSHTLEDMKQDGFMGLMVAAERFDLDLGYEFSTYATHWIRQFIVRGAMDKGLLIRLPAHQFDKVLKLSRLEAQGDETDEFLAQEMQVRVSDIEQIRAIREKFYKSTSLNTVVGDDASLEDFIVSPHETPEEKLMRKELTSVIDSLLLELKPRETEVIRLRFGLNSSGTPLTLEEVGKQFNVTRERIRQIEFKALKKLSKYGEEELKIFLEGE